MDGEVRRSQGASGIDAEQDLVVRAARLLQVHCGTRQGADISLDKRLPAGGGLGGGSSDAGTLLRGLNALLDAKLTDEELNRIGVRLGADVPLFTTGWPCAWATGIGEKLKRAAPLDQYLVLLVNPGFPVSTKMVFQRFALTRTEKNNSLKSSQKEKFETGSDEDFLQRSIMPDELVNDLEAIAGQEFEQIFHIKRLLLDCGAENALMTGSGPTVFGLFDRRRSDAAEHCYRNLKKSFHATFLTEPLLTEDTVS